MNVGSLFSGIGGLDLGLERAGMRVRWQSEIDPYASRVLAKHWPTVPNLGDITTIDWSQVEPVDLICGGYPCQPFSLAGVRRGESDPRHLWPHFARAIRLLRPRFALLENVPGHLSMGFGRVLGDLAELGYDTEWDCIPAAAVGAPHLRYRVLVVATNTDEQQHQSGAPAIGRAATQNVFAHADSESQPGITVDAVQRSGQLVPDTGSGECVRQRPRIECTQGGHSQRDLHSWAVEPDVGRVAHGVPHRVDRLRCLGNAVVPQVAEWIGRRILATCSPTA